MRRILYFFNTIRSAPVWLISIILGVDEILCEDMEGYRYAVELETERKLKRFWLFNRITAKRKLFHNVVQFRIKNESKLLSYIVAIFLPIKKDLEISQGEIGGGLTLFHGHGSVIVCQKAGKNLTVYQGATIGKNSKTDKEKNPMPIIGDNVTVYTNAVVAGNIVIGDNVEIGAGTVVMKDVPSNTVVIGNPCRFRKK